MAKDDVIIYTGYMKKQPLKGPVQRSIKSTSGSVGVKVINFLNITTEFY